MPRKTKEDEELPSDTVVKSTCTVRRTYTKNGRPVEENTDVENIEIHRFVTTPAEVAVQFGSTINLGNFEGVRVDVWCKIPAYREELAEAYEFAKNFADTRMNEELQSIEDSRSKKTKKQDNFF